MIRFIDEHRDRFGVEFLCRTLRAAVRGFLTSRGYRAAKKRLASTRQLRDEILVPEIKRLHHQHYGVYGRRKMHALLQREGWEIGRDACERLMKLAGVRGVRRSRRAVTTKSHPADRLPSDLVNRNFTATAPKRLWVVDITYVATWSGFAYVSFVTDVYSRRIVGWNVASTLKAEVLPLQALEMAAWQCGGNLEGLVHHSDHGSNGGFNWLSQHPDPGGVQQWQLKTGSRKRAMCPRILVGSGARIGRYGPRCDRPGDLTHPVQCNASSGV